MPAACNTKAEIRQIEPYVYCQSTHSKYSPRYGASRLPWLSGAVTWAYYSVSQYILGLQPQYDGIIIDPCIPSEWKEFKMTRKFRKKQLNIQVDNRAQVEKGVKKIICHGKEMEGKYIPLEKLKDHNDIKVIMG